MLASGETVLPGQTVAAAPAAGLSLDNPFGLTLNPPRSLDEQRHQLHCDVLRHLKVPITHRRLDSYMRPAFIEPASKADGTKVAGRWSVLDLYGLNMQLGLIKPPGH